jgi:hypothetical protein
LVAYLLNPKHPKGGSKARFFMALGFAPDAPEAEEVSRQPGYLGQGLVLVLRGPLRGPRREVFLQSVWYLEGEVARLVTAYPWRGR